MIEEKKILSKCSEITMDKFIECLVNKNYSCLILSGQYLSEELERIWTDVFYEYCDLTNSKDYQLMLKYMKSISINEAKLTVINLCLIVLSHSYNQECVDLLKKYGYNYKFDESDNESFLKDLQNVQNTSKMAVINLQNDRKQLEKITDKKQSSIKESDFDKIFISLSKYMGYPVRKRDLTVSEYCSMINVINKK